VLKARLTSIKLELRTVYNLITHFG